MYRTDAVRARDHGWSAVTRVRFLDDGWSFSRDHVGEGPRTPFITQHVRGKVAAYPLKYAYLSAMIWDETINEWKRHRRRRPVGETRTEATLGTLSQVRGGSDSQGGSERMLR